MDGSNHALHPCTFMTMGPTNINVPEQARPLAAPGLWLSVASGDKCRNMLHVKN